MLLLECPRPPCAQFCASAQWWSRLLDWSLAKPSRKLARRQVEDAIGLLLLCFAGER